MGWMYLAGIDPEGKSLSHPRIETTKPSVTENQNRVYSSFIVQASYLDQLIISRRDISVASDWFDLVGHRVRPQHVREDAASAHGIAVRSYKYHHRRSSSCFRGILNDLFIGEVQSSLIQQHFPTLWHERRAALTVLPRDEQYTPRLQVFA